MEERIERRIPESRSTLGKIILHTGDLLAHGGFGRAGEIPIEEIEEIEGRGFELEAVQDYIDGLTRSSEVPDQKDAAMLRGAFNELLGRLDRAERYMPQGMENA